MFLSILLLWVKFWVEMINDTGKSILQLTFTLSLHKIYLASWWLHVHLGDAESFKEGYCVGSNCDVKDNTA